jgi:LacI family transcriptional regulator
MSQEKATITTLAKATGLSLATVSRALAGSPSVLPGTRDKVIEAARQLNYVRDRAAVRLKTGKTHVIAFIMDRADASQPGFKDLLLGLSDAVQGTDYHLIVVPDAGEDDPLGAVRYIVERGLADGLVLSHTTPQDERVSYLQEKAYPFITHGRTRLAQPHGFVDFANEQFAAMGVRALMERSRQRLGILLPMRGSAFRTHLADGFAQACQNAEVQGSCVDAVSLDDDPEAIYQWAMAHAAQYDGLVVSREAPVLPLLSALGDQGMQVGRDIDLVIKYSSSLPQYIRQPFMACYEDLHLAGKTMGQSLLAHFSHSGLNSAQVLFPPPQLEFFHMPP